ncbi:MAG: DUF2318 domain-containing protein [Candidatus Pacebacteria bacterium]|nr:DUF2318 domain-containing protein [Candidatus Paceibacterota bacterium]
MFKKYLPVIVVVFIALGGAYIMFNKSADEIGDNSKASINQSAESQNEKTTQVKFSGEQGKKVELENGKVILAEESFENTEANFYNTKLSNGKTVYYFVVRDKQGIFRAAANACQVCFDSRTGFRQQGDYMVCNTCGNKYPLEKIATEKGGCNPGPINPNLEVANGKVMIQEKDLQEVAYFF